MLRGASLSLARGEVVALVAPPSGAGGKSTLLHIAGGLLDTADAGQVAIAGQDMTHKSDRRRTAVRREEVGFVYQFHHLLPEFTAAENVVLPQLANGVGGQGEANTRALDLLGGRVDVAKRATHRPAELSGGEQQRVASAVHLPTSPRCCWRMNPPGTWIPRPPTPCSKPHGAGPGYRPLRPHCHPQPGAGGANGPRAAVGEWGGDYRGGVGGSSATEAAETRPFLVKRRTTYPLGSFVVHLVELVRFA